jgi:hypothetical protein
MFGTASGGPLQQRKAVGGDESLDTANKALQHDALSKLHTQAGAENTMVDVLGDETVDLIKNPPPVPENTPERDKKNKAVAKQAKKAKKRTFQIMASTGPYGTVFVDGAEDLGTIEVMQGEPQTFDFIPDEGCKLVRLGLALTMSQTLESRSEFQDLSNLGWCWCCASRQMWWWITYLWGRSSRTRLQQWLRRTASTRYLSLPRQNRRLK